MNFKIVRLVSLLTLTVVSIAAVAGPGQPIGGVIVKGGKNPGGQMLVLATTNSKGRFDIAFSEEGEYRIEFGMGPKTTPREAPIGEVRLDYVVTPMCCRSQSKPTNAPRKTILSNSFNNARLLIVVPKEGADISGVFRSAATNQGPAADRNLEHDDQDVSVKSSRPKGGIK